jgi:hypothetical protein
VKAALPPWLFAHVLVGVALLADHIVRAETTLKKAPVGTALHHGLLSWDADWYLRIAQHGYGQLPREGLRFFPVLPLMARVLGSVTGGAGNALLLISLLASLAFVASLRHLVATDFHNQAVADRSAWIAALAPAAFVLVMGYTEALAGLLAVLTFLLARQRRWRWVIVTSLLAGALRPSGVLLMAPLAWEAARQWNARPKRERGWIMAAVIAPLIGVAPYLVWVQARYGDAFLPYSVQEARHLRGPYANPITTVSRALGDVAGHDLVLGLRGLWVLVFLALLLVMTRRLPGAYTVYAAVTLITSVATKNLGSFERYAYGAFPFVIAAAMLIRGKTTELIVVGLLAAAMTTYALLAFLDLYVP